TEILGLGDRERIKRAFRAKMKRLSEKVLQGNIRAMDRAAREVIREM
ncbi:MAG: hypothetical protein GXW89_04540, partial [Phycisphaerae bacterium]|nr:hypothetical protein [Phycisphaerae bacterium]